MRLTGLVGMAMALAAPVAAPTQAQTVQELTQRLEAFEAELRRLTGALERMAFERRRDQATLEALLREYNYRLIELEGGDPTAALTAPPLFGDAAQPAAPPPPAPATPEQPGEAEASSTGRGAPPAPLGVLSVTLGEAERAAFDAARRDLDAVGLAAGRRAFDAFLTDYPDSPLRGEALWRLGDAYAAAGQHNEAARAHLRAVRDHPDSPYAPPNLLGLADALAALDRAPEACAAFREYVVRHGDADASALERAQQGAAQACG